MLTKSSFQIQQKKNFKTKLIESSVSKANKRYGIDYRFCLTSECLFDIPSMKNGLSMKKDLKNEKIGMGQGFTDIFCL